MLLQASYQNLIKDWIYELNTGKVELTNPNVYDEDLFDDFPNASENQTVIQDRAKLAARSILNFEILFTATKNGCTAQAFHQLCDNKGPTVTIATTEQGHLIGGYTRVPWTSTSQHSSDVTAFIFCLNGAQCWPLKPQYAANAVYHLPQHGPNFGPNATVSFMSNAGYGYYAIKSGQRISTLGVSCNGNLHSIFNCVNGQFTYPADNYISNGIGITALEVYKVTGLDAMVAGINTPKREEVKEVKLQEPWRKCDGWSTKIRDDLKRELESYSPFGGFSFPARLLLIGPVGAGKSSFFNTVSSVFRGHVTGRALSGSSQHSLTAKFRSYKIRSNAGSEPLKFVLCDTMGLEESSGLTASDLGFVMDGFIPDGFQFNPIARITKSTPGLLTTAQTETAIHSVITVLDGSTLDVLSTNIIEKLHAIKDQANQRGIPVVTLLTKIDRLCSHVSANTCNVFNSTEVHKAVTMAADKLGLPVNHVLPVKNYDSEVDLDCHIDILTLTSLRQILRFADDFFEEIFEVNEEQH